MSLVLFLGWALSACGDDKVARHGGSGDAPMTRGSGSPKTIEGSVLDVMESWPLQLTVQTQGGRCHIELLTETVVSRSGQRVEAGELKPGVRVRIEGEGFGPNALTAREVRILP